MIIYLKGVQQKYVLVFDIEFDQKDLVQFAGILLKQVGENLFITARSVNQYVVHKPSYHFQRYTGLTKTFLTENGITLKDLAQVVEDVLLKDVPRNDLLVVSHGLKNDRLVLSQNLINLIYDIETLEPIKGYCTFINARRLLERASQLKLSDISREIGVYPISKHDAFSDVWSTIAVFSYLRALE